MTRSTKTIVLMIFLFTILAAFSYVFFYRAKDISLDEKKELMKLIDDIDWLDKYYEEKLTNEEMNEQMILEMSLILSTSREDALFDEEYDYDVVNEFSNRYFNRTAAKTDFLCQYDGVALYKYDENSNKYIYNVDHLGHDANSCEVINSYLKGTKKDNTYTVIVKKVFLEEDANTKKNFYDTYKKALSGNDTPIFTIDLDETSDLKEAIERHVSENVETILGYRYTFIKVKDDFVFESVERI